MSFFNEIISLELWEEFLERETNKDVPDKKTIKSIESIIKQEEYKNYTKEYFNNFPITTKKELSRYNTSKKRIVYVYPWRHRVVLKGMGYYILRKYNSKFAPNSLAYVWGKGVKTAFRKIEQFKLKPKDIIYKNDFSDYFNAIDLNVLNQKLDNFMSNDEDLIQIIMDLLKEDKVMFKGNTISIPNKGVMAGTPIAGILANIYMHEVDMKMLHKGHRYLRYADDTIVVGKKALEDFQKLLEPLHIKFNPKKEETFTLETGLTFLGFTYEGKTIRISDEARDKMKSRMKRRAKWYRQWMIKNNVPKKVAIRHYIKGINEKLYSRQSDTVDWTQWYLPAINDTEALKYLDLYFVNCIRFLDSGTWHRGRKFYNLQYEDIKKLGFKSLINTYYKIQKQMKQEAKRLEELELLKKESLTKLIEANISLEELEKEYNKLKGREI